MPYGPLPTPQQPWPQQIPASTGNSSRLTAAVIVLTAVSLLALGVAAAAWFRAAPRADKVYSAQEQTSARDAVCSAHASVKQALTAATRQPEAKQPGNTLLIAINIRLAEYASADYLADKLAAYPATPRAVTDPMGGLVDALRRLAIGQLGDAPAESLQPITEQIGSLTDEVTKACEGHT